ncbi:unnamed protein product, partial [Ixodes hexagonus]
RILQINVQRLKRLEGVQDRIAENMKKLANYVQERIHDLQNPVDCSTAPKLLCRLTNKSGLASGVHSLLWCLVAALRGGRTLVLDSSKWNYAPENDWIKTFLPITGPSCKGANAKKSRQSFPEAGKVQRKIIDIPSAIVKPLVSNHGSPYAWWYGQLVGYILRLQNSTMKKISEFKKSRGYKHPIVGVHIRRTDKYVEASYHAVDEYMIQVEDYYAKLALTMPVEKKRVFVATDEPRVVDEIRKKYSQYDVINSEVSSHQANRIRTRRHNTSLFGVMLDITLLAESDFLVCTMSSGFCRVAYELMQTRHPDGSMMATSLDVEYFFAFISFPRLKTLYGNQPASARELGWSKPGLLIERPWDNWALNEAIRKKYNDGFNPGRKVGASKAENPKLFPRFKATQTYRVANFTAFTSPFFP